MCRSDNFRGFSKSSIKVEATLLQRPSAQQENNWWICYLVAVFIGSNREATRRNRLTFLTGTKKRVHKTAVNFKIFLVLLPKFGLWFYPVIIETLKIPRCLYFLLLLSFFSLFFSWFCCFYSCNVMPCDAAFSRISRRSAAKSLNSFGNGAAACYFKIVTLFHLCLLCNLNCHCLAQMRFL